MARALGRAGGDTARARGAAAGSAGVAKTTRGTGGAWAAGAGAGAAAPTMDGGRATEARATHRNGVTVNGAEADRLSPGAADGATAAVGAGHGEPNVLDPFCDSREVLDLVADKWSAIIVYALAGRTLRYSELQRAIGGISQKMLTQTLRRMERDGLIERCVHPVVPPRVEYALSGLGATLIEPLSALCRWAEGHMHEVHGARSRSSGEA